MFIVSSSDFIDPLHYEMLLYTRECAVNFEGPIIGRHDDPLMDPLPSVHNIVIRVRIFTPARPLVLYPIYCLL